VITTAAQQGEQNWCREAQGISGQRYAIDWAQDHQMTGRKTTNNAIATTAAVIVFPNEGPDERVEQVAIQKNCNIQFNKEQ
jgi:hypothetical protein